MPLHRPVLSSAPATLPAEGPEPRLMSASFPEYQRPKTVNFHSFTNRPPTGSRARPYEAFASRTPEAREYARIREHAARFVLFTRLLTNPASACAKLGVGDKGTLLGRQPRGGALLPIARPAVPAPERL